MKIDHTFKKLIEMSSCKKIMELCKPLELFKITYFLYAKHFSNGNQIFLTTNPEWQHYFYESELYKKEAELIRPQYQNTGLYLWSALQNQNFFNETKDFGIQDGVTIVDKTKHYTEYWYFGVKHENSTVIINEILNNIDLIRRFMGYIKSNSIDVVSKMNHILAEYQLPILERSAALEKKKGLNVLTRENLRNEFVKMTDSERYYITLNGQENYITKKEMICLHHLKDGLTASEISDVLCVSKRTVETHIEHIKEKIDCSKQFQLAYKLAKSFII